MAELAVSEQSDGFREAFFARKLSDKEKIELITELESHPALWMTCAVFTRAQKATSLNSMSLRFSLNEECIKKVLHSLRSSMVREIRREREENGYESSWKFYKRLNFMKEDILRSLQQEADKQWNDEEILKLIELYEGNPVLWDHLSQEYRDRNLRKLAIDKIKESFKKRTEEDIKNQWHTLKTIHQREHKRQEASKKSGSATSEVYKTKWKFFESMSFVLRSSEVDGSQSTWNEHNLEVEEVAPVPPARKRKLGEANEEMKAELYKTCINALKPINDEKLTEDETFGKTVADTLARHTGLPKILAKKKINDVLFELEMGALNDGISQSSTMSPTGPGVQYILSTPNFSHFRKMHEE